MAYTGNNQTSVSETIARAIAGMIGDSGFHDIVSRTVSSAGAIDAGRIVISSSTDEIEYPDADADVLDHPVGLTVYDPMKEPYSTTARFAAGASCAVMRSGRGFAAVKTGTPTKNAPVYVYVGATTADRGKVSPTAAAGYVQLRGARFTGVLESTTFAEIQFNDAAALPFPAIKSIQITTGTLVAGTKTLSDVKVTANSYAFAIPTTAITTTTNFACLQHLKASDVVGDIGTGNIVINAITSTGVLDVDAAGSFVAIVIN